MVWTKKSMLKAHNHCHTSLQWEINLRVQLLFEPIKQHKQIATQCHQAYHWKLLQFSTIHEVHSMLIDFLHALPKFLGWT